MAKSAAPAKSPLPSTRVVPVVRVFYSWQSDLKAAHGRTIIEKCLDAAKASLEAERKGSVEVYIDQATRDETGAPHIPETILSKIKSADVFVADITTINAHAKPKALRRVPNPNVMLELGFAVSQLGWERVIILFNNKFGTFPKDITFDLDKRRVTVFSRAEGDNDAAIISAKKSLSSALHRHILAILDANPMRPMAIWAEGAKRARDLESLHELCRTFTVEALERQIDDIQGGFVSDEVLFYYIGFNALVSSFGFHVYNSDLATRIAALHSAWTAALPNPDFTDGVSNGYRMNRNDEPLSKEEQAEWERVKASAAPLHAALSSFLSFVRDNYEEVDFKALGADARRYRAEISGDAASGIKKPKRAKVAPTRRTAHRSKRRTKRSRK